MVTIDDDKDRSRILSQSYSHNLPLVIEPARSLEPKQTESREFASVILTLATDEGTGGNGYHRKAPSRREEQSSHEQVQKGLLVVFEARHGRF